jgi:hypothetical protein
VVNTRGALRKLVVLLLLCAAAAALLPGRAAALDSCGRPERATNWIDWGSVALTDVLARPGTILAVSSGGYPEQVRQRGAVTVYGDLYLKARVGQPSTPLDPAEVPDQANRFFDYASTQSSCSTPWIAENELFGAWLETPWSAANAQYRANVLTYLQTLAARGARPFLLVNSAPYTGGEAAAWWQQVAAVSDIVRETYYSAKRIHAQGAIVGNRTLRQGLRAAVGKFLAIGIPPSRLGVMLNFESDGTSGRAGLRPAQAWFEVAKWQALAARQVAEELKISSIWSWGWATYSGVPDPDKAAAACVWLWTRAPSLCNGPGAAGSGWDASLTEGQLELPRGVQCTVGKQRITAAAISQLQALTGDREIAYSALFARVIERKLAPVTWPQVIAVERGLVAARFGGSMQSYRAALAQAHVSLSLARGILTDELRRAQLARKLPARPPAATEIEDFYESYPDMLVRAVKAKPAPSWLGWKSKGFAIEATAPGSVFGLESKTTKTLQTIEGAYKVRAVGDAQPLGTMPLSIVMPAIRATLASFAQVDAFEQRTTNQLTAALAGTSCRGDDLPVPGPVELETLAPFLSVSG